MTGVGDYNALDQGLVDDKAEWLRHQINASTSVYRCSLERTNEETYFIVEFNRSKIPHDFFESYGLEFKECRTVWSDNFLKWLLLGERWITGVGVPKESEFGEGV